MELSASVYRWPRDRTFARVARAADRRGVTGRDVFAYFNNDGQGHAVRNSAVLASMLDAAQNQSDQRRPSNPRGIAERTAAKARWQGAVV